MQALIQQIESIRNSKIKNLIDWRMSEFKYKRSDEEIFQELCFCILTANFNAKGGMKIQSMLGNNFLNLTEEKLAEKLKQLGHRFPNSRASYIVEARKHKDEVIKLIKSNTEQKQIREWLVENVKGLGYKESSHFLRNIGFNNLAIIDFHILDILEKNNLIEKPKTLSKAKYLEIEQLIENLSEKINMSLGELDLYLWYLETGKVLK